MQAGRLDRRISIERNTPTRNDLNEDIPSWSVLATVWASKEDVRDTERQRAAESGQVITTRWQIRWSSDVASVDGRDRVVHGDRVYQIQGVKEIGRREGLELTTSARNETPA